MFKKAQLKLFSLIVSILLAVFIALLSAINIITQEVISRQSQYVLEQIAAGIEYDNNEESFVLNRPESTKSSKNKKNNIWEKEFPTTEKPTTTETETTTTTSTTSVTTTTVTTAVETDSPTEEITEEYTEPEEIPKESVIEDPPPVQETDPTEPPVENTEPPTWWNPYDPNQNPQWDNNIPQWDGTGVPPWGWYPWGWYPYNYNGIPAQSNEPDGNNTYWQNTETENNEAFEQTAFDELYDGGIVQLGNIPDSDRLYDGGIMSLENSKPDNKPDNSENAAKHNNEAIPKTLGSIDFFVIMSDNNGKYISSLNNDELDQATAQKYVLKVLNSGSSSGMLDKLQYCSAKKNNGTLIVFTDKSGELEVLSQLKRTTVIIGIISILILSIVSYFLSKKSIEPIEMAFGRQKQFISDASHELKTPLTVISANADVLSGEIGDNKWLKYIQSQTERMNVLVNDLLNLTRLENNSSDFIRTDFDMSKAIMNTALPFECQAFEQNKKFSIDVDDGIMVNGSERHIKQMAAIFIDNALKYSDDGGTVKVMLKKQGDKKIFSVYNTGSGVKDEDKEKIFERFYRSDASRNRATGGYGLGLAIAKSIIDKHKFKVHVLNREGKSICFVVTL